MTRRVNLPTDEDVRRELSKLQFEDAVIPSAKRLAEKLGLANSTFWRYFPEIAQQVADARRETRATTPPKTVQKASEEPALRAENARLRKRLELAIAHIHRLSVENEALREAVGTSGNIIKFPSR
ncbi:hypothetical protein NQ166_08790 [Microbacterium sp. zg.Y1090]|uniref:hypothetical protein n=1 Tax=Microbacterium wangruii TaxID=3049073 RepID=UPI00214DE3CF|nr:MULTISPECIES: hypothetical protein [unclassified Microbacterium]MCR2818922.1 hypothetical protein [Microbacterium sp. zg.Y1090]WIM27229.1 hypothetical protein QNO26_08600 [Microbacterium sp. zg-Y1090]